MKIKILLILVLIIGLPLFVFAQVDKEFVLPVYEDQKQANKKLESEFIQGFGEDSFLYCYDCPGADNPFAVAKCLRAAQYCLLDQDVPELQCAAGFTPSGGVCISAQIGCQERFGAFSKYSGSAAGNTYNCECQNGFSWNIERTACTQVACPNDMIYYSPYKDDNDSFIHGRCMGLDEACQSEFGEFSQSAKQDSVTQDIYCTCQTGYELDITTKECTEAVVVAGITGPDEAELAYINTLEREVANSLSTDPLLANRVKGRILLQVDEAGEAWYVNPDDSKRYFLATPSKALEIMSRLGLGATHEFIAAHDAFPQYVAGKILIDTEDLGRAYYIDPVNRHRYYLGSPLAAFNLLQKMSLGISNNDLRQIPVGKLSQ